MAHVIVQGCCNDASCVPVCPVDCIRPAHDDPNFNEAEQLYIEPDVCIDCGACVDVCPVDAIRADVDLTAREETYRQSNAQYFEQHPLGIRIPGMVSSPARRADRAGLSVAIIGAGPAGCYAAAALLERGATVSMLDKLPTPHGLVRAGVAPDHQSTKRIGIYFDSILADPDLDCYFNVQVGVDVSLPEVAAHHDAVIWAVGSGADRSLGIPGEDLAGCHPVREFVAWYNGHPSSAEMTFDLSSTNAVIIGNGNVAIDAARMLMLDYETLAGTDMAEHAIDALRDSRLREVTIAARRGPAHAAFTLSELTQLTHLDAVDLRADLGELTAGDDFYPGRDDQKHAILRSAATNSSLAARRINLRFWLTPVAINGQDRVHSVTFMRNQVVSGPQGPILQESGETETIPAGLVLRAIGYRGEPIAGLPFDVARGTINNDRGRVVDPESDSPLTGMYCTGWIKRGATGVIGTNKRDAAMTVDCVFEDAMSGRLSAPIGGRTDFAALVQSRQARVVDFDGWSRIHQAEAVLGRQQSRPRRKFIAVSDLLRAAEPDYLSELTGACGE